ncbi:hypothetical protein KGP36_01425 [Patescibacteria group bacterium]|nr:hypothetical protein [Patescibacteria group bacterium]
MRISSGTAIAAAAAAMALGLAGYYWHEQSRPRVLEIFVFDLSSGRAMLLRTPNDRRILVDGGGNGDIMSELSSVLPFYSRRIDAVIATGADAKETVGLVDALKRYDVGDLYLPAVTAEGGDDTYKALLDEASSKKVPVHGLAAGDSIVLDERVGMEALFPAPSGSFAYSKSSSPELLFRISYGATSALFMGAATPKVQKFVASSAKVLKSDVLIVSQSAIQSNMAAKFTEAVSPAYLIYAKAPGGTAKSQPVPAGIGFNIKEKGTMKIVSDGGEIRVEPLR